MKLASGVDLLDIARFRAIIERHGERFLRRVFTPEEIELCGGRIESLAARFAAKEAAVKALGSGIGPVGWKELEIGRGSAGEPLLVLHGTAAGLAVKLGLTDWSVSLSHTPNQAIAVVVGLGK